MSFFILNCERWWCWSFNKIQKMSTERSKNIIWNIPNVAFFNLSRPSPISMAMWSVMWSLTDTASPLTRLPRRLGPRSPGRPDRGAVPGVRLFMGGPTNHPNYPLVLCYIAMENDPFIVDFPIKKWWFSIAMLVIARGYTIEMYSFSLEGHSLHQNKHKNFLSYFSIEFNGELWIHWETPDLFSSQSRPGPIWSVSLGGGESGEVGPFGASLWGDVGLETSQEMVISICKMNV